MKYNIKNVPTEYNGRLFRSRLEARWARFFDLLEWDFEYEPFDLNGWSPDFLLRGKYIKHDLVYTGKNPFAHLFKHLDMFETIDHPVLVEVKPLDRFDKSAAKKITDAAAGKFEVLLLGTGLLNGTKLGWLYENELKWSSGWGEAIFTHEEKYGFAHSDGSFGCRINGSGSGSDNHLCNDFTEIKRLWQEAGTATMFLKPEKVL